MKRNISRTIATVIVLLSASTIALAAGTVNIVKQLSGVTNEEAGTVTPVVSEGVCTLTITPADGNYITPANLSAIKSAHVGLAQGRTRTDPGYDVAIEITASDPSADPSGETTYTFIMPSNDADVTVTVNFMERVSIETVLESITLGTYNDTYDGIAKEPTITPNFASGANVTLDTDYTIGYEDNINAGTAKAVVSGIRVYKGKMSQEFEIKAAETTDATTGNKVTEDGNNITLTEIGGTTEVTDGTINVPSQVGGKTITALDNDIFENVNKSDLEYIDLSETGITEITVSREANADSPFAGFSENTLIFLPTGTTLTAGSDNRNVVIGTDCASLVLSDQSTTPFSTSKDFTASGVSFNRDFSAFIGAEKMATVYLPFSLTADQVTSLGEFYEFDKIENSQVKLKPAVTTTQANTPYIFKPKSGITTLSVTGSVEVKALTGATSTAVLKGTCEPITWTTLPTGKTIYGFAAETKTYGGKSISTGAFVKIVAGASIAPFRAYLEVTGTAGARLDYAISFGDDATGIKVVTTESNKTDWYSLDGRKLQAKPGKKGVYIKNGKKTVIK